MRGAAAKAATRQIRKAFGPEALAVIDAQGEALEAQERQLKLIRAQLNDHTTRLRDTEAFQARSLRASFRDRLRWLVGR